ncbi:MAG: PaaI family thioesterase [Gordonia sp. (in: high G+C Gram-positive bacteria)]
MSIEERDGRGDDAAAGETTGNGVAAADGGAGPRGDVPHEGGFRARFDVTTERGGPRYGELGEEMRRFLDLARYACPPEDETAGLIDDLRALNARLERTQVDEWTSPSGTRIDLPARGNITLPPYVVEQASADGVIVTVTFRPFHLGGNKAAHGGHVAVAFDDLGGMAAALKVSGITRTAYLTVTYRSLTPLTVPLQMHAWVETRDGRKCFVRGTLHDGDRLCAEMDALFIQLRPGQP